jgi:cobalt-precorrin 5A hydrolase/precorrin-3B C17-methyltransferase
VTGTLYGLGVGPGDPDLMTIKARNVLARVPVVAYPAPEGGSSLVRAIAAPYVPAGRTEIVISTPMSAERFPAREVYDHYAGLIAGHLDAGADVAVLCEGDPFFYGSFMYIFERLADRYPAEVVPGVSSLTAAAAAARTPLVERDDCLAVVPATLPETVLEARLVQAEAAAVFKVGRHLDKVRRVLDRLGLEGDAVYVERATMAEQRVVSLVGLDAATAPYFSTVLVRRRRRAEPGVHRPPGSAAIVALSAGGLALAQRLRRVLPGSLVHGLMGRAEPADVPFADAVAHLGRLFGDSVPIVGVCAAGILIRALAPHVCDKSAEPPVVAVAEDGHVAVPLLGGHRGANRLARTIAAATGGIAAVTTASDLRLGVALDDPPPGWRIADPAAAKPVAAALLAGEAVSLHVEAGDAGWLTASGLSVAEPAPVEIRVTDRVAVAMSDALTLHPPVLVVGVGCERDAPADELVTLVRTTLAAAGLAEGAVALVASIDLKSDEPAVHAAAEALGVPARYFSAAELEAQTPRLVSPSAVVFRAVGCHGVAEAAALAAVGGQGRLVVAKALGGRTTCAIARAPADIDPRTVGRSRGRLTIVGIGPGAATWRTSEASLALADATDVVGLGLYLDLIEDAVAGKTRHSSELTEEEGRVRRALDLAAEGRSVALVSSGDAGVYGLAALVFELLDREDRANWNRIGLAVAPGVTALQAAAARAGAPCGHDFCTVSLSDLLTPWPQIEARLRAAAAGDFVVGLYNPISGRRRTQLPAARDILLGVRAPSTPVLLARNLGRAGERLTFVTLDALRPDDVDMLTLVVVGNSQTRIVERGRRSWMYTPRGYAAKVARGRGAIPVGSGP